MVFQKTLDYGFLGHQAPQIPRAARSARRRRSFRKQIDENPMCAFDLLATVAGNLLLEKECSPSSSNTLVKKEPQSFNTPLKLEDPLNDNLDTVSRAPMSLIMEDHSGIASVVTASDCSEKADKLKCAKNINLPGSFATKVEKSFDENKEPVKLGAPKTETTSVGTTGDMYSSDIMLENNNKLLLCDKYITSDSLPVGGGNDVNLVIRDDDENSCRCTKFGTRIKAFRPSPRVGDRRIRKLLASKYWKVTSKSKEMTSYKADSEMKPAYDCRKNCYKRYRSQRDYPFKKRRLYRCNSTSNSDGGISGDNVVNFSRKEFTFDNSGTGAKVNGGSGISTRVVGQTTPLQARDSHVKLRIKSFKVPELFIELPENSTVGNLKKTVLEAVMAVLGGGLRVGVILQGKKIRDDNRTLLQSGISHDEMLEALGFSLEPNSFQSPSALQHEDCCPSLLSCDTPKQLNRYPASPSEVACSVTQPEPIDAFSDHSPQNLVNFIESDHDSAPSPPELSPDSKAIVAAPVMKAEAINMVPLNKSKRSDSAQRRIRRPFSVTEVEALVYAVEKLGTGRWRDVKLRAFDNAKHRTYVDLKDKWKTLVHTARISPQQRRGEPVPQDLLDRVLSAHAYWSHQQPKQHHKHHSETRLLL